MLRSRLLLVLTLATSLGLAGCLAGEDVPTAESGAADKQAAGAVGDGQVPGTGMPVETFYLNGTHSLSAGIVELAQKKTSFDFKVRPNATRIVAELAWTGQATDLDVVLVSPKWCGNAGSCETAVTLGKIMLSEPMEGWFQNRGGSPIAPDNPSRLEIDPAAIEAAGCGEEACSWGAWAYSKTAALATLSFRVDVFYGSGAETSAP